jgi:hypothetical protein
MPGLLISAAAAGLAMLRVSAALLALLAGVAVMGLLLLFATLIAGLIGAPLLIANVIFFLLRHDFSPLGQQAPILRLHRR